MLSTVLLIIALVLFILEAVGWPKTAVKLGWFGLAAWVLVSLIGK